MTDIRSHLSRIILPLTAVLLILIALFSYRKIRDLISYSNRIEHTQELQYYLERLNSTIKSAETNQRGYLLTNDSTFLTAYYASDTTITDFYQQIKPLIQNDTFQQNHLQQLIKIVSDRFTMLSYVISQKDILMKESNAEKRKNVMLVGKKSMDDARNLINLMRNHENQILHSHRMKNSDLKSITPLLLLGLSLFSLLLIFYSYRSISHELNQKIFAQRALEIKIDELNRSNSELEQFAYVASHDLQEPLRKIRSFGDRLLIRYQHELNPDARESIEKMQNAAGRMQTLIDDLLSFSRLVNVKQKFETVQLDMIIKEVISDLEVSIRQKNGKIICGPLPEIEGIPSQLRQLFQNLLSNSIKFSREDVNPEVHIRATTVHGKEIAGINPNREQELFHKIEVADNGIGFDEKYLDRIFIIFQRLHGKMEYGGTGIGLAVTKKIMNIHNGMISATSKPGEGSEFYLYFPVKAKVT